MTFYPNLWRENRDHIRQQWLTSKINRFLGTLLYFIGKEFQKFAYQLITVGKGVRVSWWQRGHRGTLCAVFLKKPATHSNRKNKYNIKCENIHQTKCMTSILSTFIGKQTLFVQGENNHLFVKGYKYLLGSFLRRSADKNLS